MNALLPPSLIDPVNLDFELPADLIAQEPLAERDQARLMVVNRSSGSIDGKKFSDLTQFLAAGDVLVLNRAKVSPAKLVGRKETGGRVEMICIGPSSDPFLWRSLIRPELRVGTEFVLRNGVHVKLEARAQNGENLVRFLDGDPATSMEQEGRLPLPPYIKRQDEDARTAEDGANYQTVYASVPGSLAAPTAGLHFTTALLSHLRAQGVKILEIVLQVGWGTFKPIKGDFRAHMMLPEKYEVDRQTYDELVDARRSNRRIFAVGTTVTRVLESLNDQEPPDRLKGETQLFIRPGFSFQWLSGLITNFHVPRSTPISLTAAFLGMDRLEDAYRRAIQEKYRFYSYGDAMLIL